MSDARGPGRLCNQIFRGLAISIIAEKNNLSVIYDRSYYEIIKNIGINLFNGENKFNKTITLTDDNYFKILNQKKVAYNLNSRSSYFQTREISNFLYNYLNSETVKTDIINNNRFKSRYNNNNDCYIHIRLGDETARTVHFWGFEYYDKSLSLINFDNLYVSSDSPEHYIVQNLLKKYKNSKLINFNLEDTIKFASTNKHIILTQGTFSATIGYLSFFSDIYYGGHKHKIACQYGNLAYECYMGSGTAFDVLSIPGWNKFPWDKFPDMEDKSVLK